MEFLGLAVLMFLGRAAVDIVAMIKGTTPPHLEKARLRADERRRKAEQGGPGRGRSPYASGKPTLGDVAAVYWGDALADVIASHDRRRNEKQRQREENTQAAAEGRPSAKVRPGVKQRISRFVSLLWNGPQRPDAPSEPNLAEGVDATRAVEAALDAGPVTACDDCGATLTDSGTGPRHPAGSQCSKTWAPSEPPVEGTTPANPTSHDRPVQPAPGIVTRPAPQAPGPYHGPDVRDRRARLDELMKRLDGWLRERDWPLAKAVIDTIKDEFPSALNDPKVGLTTYNLESGATQWLSLQTIDHWVKKHLHRSQATPANKGDNVTDTTATPTTGTATGDAHNVETALQQCQALDDDLVRIDTALDVIDEAIGSAAAAAERIQGFLQSKNVHDSAVGGMAQATDMLSAERIKSLIDCVAAARAGVKAAEEELRRLQDLEQQLQGADGSVLNGR